MSRNILTINRDPQVFFRVLNYLISFKNIIIVNLFSSRSSVVFLAYSQVILTGVNNTADDQTTVPHLYLQVME